MEATGGLATSARGVEKDPVKTAVTFVPQPAPAGVPRKVQMLVAQTVVPAAQARKLKTWETSMFQEEKFTKTSPTRRPVCPTPNLLRRRGGKRRVRG